MSMSYFVVCLLFNVDMRRSPSSETYKNWRNTVLYHSETIKINVVRRKLDFFEFLGFVSNRKPLPFMSSLSRNTGYIDKGNSGIYQLSNIYQYVLKICKITYFALKLSKIKTIILLLFYFWMNSMWRSCTTFNDIYDILWFQSCHKKQNLTFQLQAKE